MSASPKPSGGDNVGQSPEDRLLAAIRGAAKEIADAPGPTPASGGPGGPSGPSLRLHERDKLIHNEKTKLTAGTINSVALAFIVGGPVATLIGALKVEDWPTATLLSVVWIATGFILHLYAKAHLEALQ